MKKLIAWMIGAGLAQGASAADPRIGKLVRYDAGDYTIYTSRSASQARDFIGDLAKFRVALEKLLGKRAVDTLKQMQEYIARRDAANAEYEAKVAEYEKKYGKGKKKK
jgi:hypothetical protein